MLDNRCFWCYNHHIETKERLVKNDDNIRGNFMV